MDEFHSALVARLAKSGSEILKDMSPEQAHLLHMAIGVAGEAGELLDAIKKSVIYGKTLDHENVVEELGDIMFYMQGIMNTLGIDRNSVIQHNIDKLNKRYPGGSYDNKDAQTRADKE